MPEPAVTSLLALLAPNLGKLAANIAKAVLGPIIKQKLLDRAEAATIAKKAMEEWAIALHTSFALLGFDDDEIVQMFADYVPAFENFFADPEVVGQLMRPFHDATPDPALAGC